MLLSTLKSKMPKICTPGSDKMAYTNSADQDQTTAKGAVWSGSTLSFH